MINLPVQILTKDGAKVLLFSATQGNKFINKDNTFLVIRNDDVSSKTITFLATNKCNYTSYHDLQFTAEASKRYVVGMFSRKRFNDDDGKITISYSDVTNLKISAIRMSHEVIDLSIERITEILEIGNEIGTCSSGKVTVTTSSVNHFAADEDRTFLALTNNNAYDCWIGLGEDAVVGEGMLISANGGNVIFDKYNIYKGDIYIIADGASNDIAYCEGVS